MTLKQQEALAMFVNVLRDIEFISQQLGHKVFTDASFATLTKWRDTLWIVHQTLTDELTAQQQRHAIEKSELHQQGYEEAMTDLQQMQMRMLQLNHPLLSAQFTQLQEQMRSLPEGQQHPLMALKRGTCWCEMGIGNPQVREHTEVCVKVQEYMKRQPLMLPPPQGG